MGATPCKKMHPFQHFAPILKWYQNFALLTKKTQDFTQS